MKGILHFLGITSLGLFALLLILALAFSVSTGIFAAFIFGLNVVLHWLNGAAYLGFAKTVGYGAACTFVSMIVKGLFGTN